MWLGGTLRIKEKVVEPHGNIWKALELLEEHRRQAGWRIKNIQMNEDLSKGHTICDVYLAKNFEHRDFDIQKELKDVNALTCKVDLYTSHDSHYQPK